MEFKFESPEFEKAKERIAKECNKITTHKITMNQNNIKPQELMIGNWVEQGQIIEIKQRTVRVKYQADGKEKTSLILHEDLISIPLSDEVLKQHGFKPTDDNVGLTLWSNDEDNYWSITWHRNNLVSISSTLRGSGFSGLTLTNVEYFHELQNAIYLATKTDWEVSLT